MSILVEYTEPIWRGLNMRALRADEAYLNLQSNYSKNSSYVYTLSDACYSCPYTKLHTLSPAATDASANLTSVQKAYATLKLNIAQAISFKIYDHDVGHYAFENRYNEALCTLRREDLQEFGVYNLTLASNGSCIFAVDKAGVNIYYALLSVFLVFAALLLIIKIGYCAWSKFYYDEANAVADSVGDAATKATQRVRLRSLDTFRGLAIVLMIFVNSGGGGYWWIEHATWNGLHLADLVFPWFLWIMGVCIPISIKSQLGRGTSKRRICGRILWRAIKLFAIGICLNSINGPQLENLRIMGVLQRFGIAFLVCGVIHTFCSSANRDFIIPQSRFKRSIYDLMRLRYEFVAFLGLLALYFGITFGLNVPGCPRGYLGPGGKSEQAAYPNCIGGATGYIDQQVLSNAHMYQWPTAKQVYDSQAFDPEGVFGCVLTVVQVLLGILAGVIMLVHTEWMSRVKRWLIWGIILGLIGGALCNFSKESGVIPINKNMWSLSFVFVTSSLAFMLLTFLYYVIDVRHFWTGFPFTESGMNAIIMYVGHTIMHKMLPWHWRIGAMNTHFMLLFEATWNTLLWVAIALYLNAKEFYYSL